MFLQNIVSCGKEKLQVEEIMEHNTNEILFLQLVMQNQQIAIMSMGKLKHPVTDKIERNLELAKISIDTLDMLKVKTKGNLSEYEEKFLDEVIRELKLNYVEEVNKDQGKGEREMGEKENKEEKKEEK
ncbi:MAG: hypothetical protein A2057_13560 [Ignavibacteria bacterium GWA2_35_9]|nr:MAG: hypothetical protein A2057_13560 [Ignavibacteria bacterium GWA2_35_9]OGU48252.1 MAG: hypothetical protein A2000_04285 [Ignavibacteria bacterium GWB2_36_8]OGV09377.1 MAG: hypothetical protein A2330_00515 [Ignavibacteria bacterium RIFOXYB2_FULL_36_7]